MDAAIIAVVGVLGLLAGAGIGYLLGRTGSAQSGGVADPAVAAQRDAYYGQVLVLAGERDTLAARLSTAEQATASALATLDAEKRAATERIQSLREDQARLAEQFEALAGRALKANTEQFLVVAEQRFKQSQEANAGELEKRQKALETMVEPLKVTLGKVEGQLQQLEIKRAEAYAGLIEQVAEVKSNNEQLKTETASLVRALRAPQARGRWGELQLRRIVELAGMSDRCDFDEQASTLSDDGVLRPDMVVRLAGGKNIVVDSKVTLAAYIEAHESNDADYAEIRLLAHARHLRKHVNDLSAKAYWTQFSPAPEFVVLFVPGEAFLAPALERDSTLLEDAMAKKVLIATPTTLMSMLRTVAYTWQQDALTENARQVFDLGRELYDRLGKLGAQVAKLGNSIESVAKNYNAAVATLETRVLVTARRLNELKVVDGELESPRPIESGIRPLSKTELLESAEADAAIRLVSDSDTSQDPPSASSGA